MFKIFLTVLTIGFSCGSNFALAERYLPNESFEAPLHTTENEKFQETAIKNSTFENTETNALKREPVGLTFDRYFSPTTGADAMISVLRAYQVLDDAVIPNSAGDQHFGMIMGRIGKLIFIEGLLTSTQTIAQHEIFGHGYRAREFHVPNLRYHVTPWRGWISMNASKFNQLSINEQSAISAGGVEGTSILAKQIRTRWFNSQSNSIDSREADLYIRAALDQTLYVLDTKRQRDKTFPNGHDVITYITEINQWYQNTVLSSHKLRQKVLLDFIDPYLFYSAYSLGHYIIEGNQLWQYPIISIGEYQYLPAMRLALAPYGPEYQFINFIKGCEQSYIATLRYGNTGGRHSSGLSLDILRLISSDLFFIDSKADLWHQPKMFATTAAMAKGHFGAALSLVMRYRIVPKIDLTGQMGYKTTGYIPGEALRHSPILRVGFAAYL
jgi:hypothetical protein